MIKFGDETKIGVMSFERRRYLRTYSSDSIPITVSLKNAKRLGGDSANARPILSLNKLDDAQFQPPVKLLPHIMAVKTSEGGWIDEDVPRR